MYADYVKHYWLNFHNYFFYKVNIALLMNTSLEAFNIIYKKNTLIQQHNLKLKYAV